MSIVASLQKRLRNIFESGELAADSICAKFARIVGESDFDREIQKLQKGRC